MAKKRAKKQAQSKTKARTKSAAAKKPAKRRAARHKEVESSPPKPLVGSIAWRDLTVKNADAVCAFYAKVVGWKVLPIEMDGYSDYCMIPPASEMPEAGVCHKRGVNAGLPSQWLMYVVVADLKRALDQCKTLGGKQLTEIRPQGTSRFAVIKDPAGAVLGLYEIG